MAPSPPLMNAMVSQKARLGRRAQRIAQLRHPNLVRMLPLPGGAGLAPLLSEGRPLSSVTSGGTFKRFELEKVVRVLLDVLSGLAVLHQDHEDGVGFVHGQVSPQAIYVGEDGTARLVPLLNQHWTPQAQPSSNGYVAPELLLGERPDPRFDLFSVGAMLWEALAGTPLFPDPSLDAVVARWRGGHIPPLVPSVESGRALSLCAIAERAISPYPVLRFQSAAELSRAIVAAAAPPKPKPKLVQLPNEAPALMRLLPLPIAPLRTLTPLATVLDIAPVQGRASEPRGPAHRFAAMLGARMPAARGRAWVVGLGVAGLAAAALLMLSKPRSDAPLRSATPSVSSPAAVLVRPPSAPSAALAPLPSPALSASAPASSVAPANRPGPKRVPTQRKRASGSSPQIGDYGI